ncbi:MAG TPA: aldolase/citrate lyase family protein [Thermoleophilaceae bacterium]|nr:aldolase/citrate lyase family protein [Thermoleophilaceae bacterium]
MNGASPATRLRSRTRSTDDLVLTLWTADPDRARTADAAGIDRIGVDLERLGKEKRQRGLGTWISPHSLDDLERVGAELSNAALYARLDPFHDGTGAQVEAVLARGAKVVMLPMVASAAEASGFAELVGKAAEVVLLVETIDAVRRLPELVAVEGVDEVHLGLNDLALSLGLRNRWLVLADDLAVDAGRVIRAAGKAFGLGGVGRPDSKVPISPDLIYAEYARTGATGALVSRSFFRGGEADDLAATVALVRDRIAEWRRRSPEELASAHAELGRRARGLSEF